MVKSKSKRSVAIKSDPELWSKCVAVAKDKFDGVYSARMYQHALYLYKSRGGKFHGSSKRNSMRIWTNQRWRTKSGKPSTRGDSPTYERYLPEDTLRRLSTREYAASSRKKRADSSKGLQYSSQPASLKPKINKLISKSDKSRKSRRKK
jgi:hypothetical protein